MPKREICKNSIITAYSYEDADPVVLSLIEKAKEAALMAYAPYSQFQVGSAVLLSSGKVITGNNQENAAYPSGLCAERVACFAAKSQYPETTIEMIAIVAKKSGSNHFRLATPCGSCRQSMIEYENNQASSIRLFMEGEDEQIYESDSIENLLPFKFSSENLK